MNHSEANHGSKSKRVRFLDITEHLKQLFDLKTDTDRAGTIDLIKSNVEFQSSSAWTLVFAILIASVGLNINSAAVIIGAMLISPLMGPIVGVGYALGTYDFTLLKKSTKSFSAAVIISILASTVYFLLSPLSEVQSELLARTRPSFFDVLIAFFGGAAGIVAMSRREKNNAIPGVAIATALMPPLCTAGFGLATRNFSYFFGALYLFVINSVFISVSTYIFVRYLGFHKITQINSAQQKTISRWIIYVAIGVLIPSFFMAWYLQRESFFNAQANKYIKQELRSAKNILVVDSEVNYDLKAPRIKVTLLGEHIAEDELDVIKSKAKLYSLSPDIIEIRQATFSESIDRKIGEKISTAEGVTNELQIKLKQKETELNNYKGLETLSLKITDEMVAVFPTVVRVIVIRLDSQKSDTSDELKVWVQWRSVPTKADQKKVSDFLSIRLNTGKSNILHVTEV